jgi:hypothetical protein
LLVWCSSGGSSSMAAAAVHLSLIGGGYGRFNGRGLGKEGDEG